MSLFSQLLKLIPRSTFKRLAKQFKVEYRSKGFSSWDQFVSMLFCQFSGANSLREIEMGLHSCEGNLSHLGINAPKRSTLAYANEHRDWHFYKALFQEMLVIVKTEMHRHSRQFAFSHKLFSIDSSTIDLCLSTFDWAKYKSTKGALKLHVRLDHDGYIPDFLVITDGKVSDVSAAWHFPYDSGSITVFDRGYIDYLLFNHIHGNGAFFVSRLKKNALFTLVKNLPLPASHDEDLLSDSIITLNGESFTEEVRLVVVRDVEGREMRFLTNNMELSAQTISDIYRERWKIELFFKELKQNLKIKTFVGTTKNAVMTQVYTALITILMLKFLKVKATYKWSMSNLVALIRMNLFTQKYLWEWINAPKKYGMEEIPPEAIQEVMEFGQQVA